MNSLGHNLTMTMFNIVLQSAALSIVSNILAQVIDSYQKNAPLTNFNLTPVLQFVTYSILNTPINCLWQDWLESAFPSTKPAAVEVPKPDSKTREVEQKQVLDVKNTLIKFFMDQTIGASFNIPLFIGIIGMLKGQSLDMIVHAVKRDFVEVYLSGMKLWPAVSIISFAAIPAERRVIFGSLAGVAWNIYLSLMAR